MFSEKQEQVLEFPYTNYDYCISDGSVRSGKSSSNSVSSFLWAMSNFNNQNFGICGKTIASVERNVVKELLKIKYITENFEVKYSSKEHLLTARRGSRINYFYVFGGKDESSYTLIQGITLAGCLFDEVALMPRSFVEQALARCSVEGAKCFFNCNPESPDHWFLQEWINQKESKNALYLHFTMDDNPGLSEKTKERFRNQYSGIFYKRYILGEWVRAEGLIYQEFADNVENYIYDTEPNVNLITIGVDYGGNMSKHTMVCCGFTNGFKDVVILEDKKVETNVTADELANIYCDFVKMCYNKYGKPITSYCDSAEQVLIKSFIIASAKNRLVNQIFNARKNEIKQRILLIQRLMKEGRFHIMRRCTNVRKALENALWDSKHPDTRLDDGTTDIDTIDAMEYSIEPFMDILLKTGG